MNDLSLKGVARRYGSINGGFSVVNNIFGVSNIVGTVSLRSRLESMAREEHSFGVSECTYGWTAAFEQTWTHVRVRIRLNPEAGISDATMDGLRSTWANGIQNGWNNQFGCSRAGELTCSLTFEVVWQDSGQHHSVRVSLGPGRSNMGRWFTTLGGGCAAHEYGHMLGLPDEYTDLACPDRDPVNTGTIMDDCSGIIARLVADFANNIGSNIVAI